MSSHELVDEVCDEERFGKMVSAGLHEIRNGVNDGLFTANYPGEENWAVAHRILVPAFGPLMIRGMFDGEYPFSVGSELCGTQADERFWLTCFQRCMILRLNWL